MNWGTEERASKLVVEAIEALNKSSSELSQQMIELSKKTNRLNQTMVCLTWAIAILTVITVLVGIFGN